MSWADCAGERTKKCAHEEDQGYNQCTEERDDGYSECTEQRDDGYRDCCDWIPCKWACDAWTWVSHIVCVVWTWVSNVICVAWTWISRMICTVWVYTTVLVCMIPLIGKYVVGVLDLCLEIGLALAGSIIRGIADFVAHPIASLGTLISLFAGCPKVRADEMQPLQVIAHHGSPLELPENTIQSCRRALNIGANALEIDLCFTADGVLVLWHDWDPDEVISLSRQLEIGSDYAFKPHVPKLGDEWRKPVIDLTLNDFREHFGYLDMRDPLDRVKWQVSHGDIDVTIPTFQEFFAEALTWNDLDALYLDIKMPASSAISFAGSMVDAIHDTIAQAQLRRLPFEIVVMVPNNLVLQVMKARATEKQYSLRFTWDVEFPPGIILNPRRYSAIGHATFHLFHNPVASVGRPTSATLFPWRVYRRTIAYDIGRWNAVNANVAGENAGVRIDSLIAWTIDERDEMACLVRMGVSGIITNKIQDLRQVANAIGR